MSDDTRFLGRPILDGAQVVGQSFRERHAQVVQHVRTRFGVALPHHEEACAGEELHARIHRGYWIVDCPTCRSAELAWRDDPRFLCTNCLNQANGGRSRPVAFPRDAEAIEAILRLRPDPATRDWLPGESVARLRRENLDHELADQ